MRLVHLTAEGVLELNYMWLPTWLGINKRALQVLHEKLSAKVVGMPATEENLDAIHASAIQVLVAEYPHIDGLEYYLDSLKFVQI